MVGLAEFIEAHSERLVNEWRESAEKNASARGLSEPELANLMPRFISQLGESDGAELTEKQQQLIESHLSHRLRQGFELAEVVLEFSLLGRIIGKLIDEQPAAERPAVPEISGAFAKLNHAIVAATKVFNKHLLEDEQREKRYARLISSIANQSLFANGAPPLADRLREVLQLIMEAMSAQSASLLLLDPHDPNKLIAAASVGLADEAVANYVTSLDSDSFASRVAATEYEPVEASAIASGLIPVSETLRTSGIHSLLGIRLPNHYRLRGVLYVGLTEERAFTPSELRRLASLGDRLTLHLDNAWLVSELRGNVAAIQIFVDVLAHDLRGPLTIAKLAASRIGDEPESLPVLLPRLVRGLDRVERMITDFLDAHRVEAGERLPLTMSEFDLVELVKDLAEEVNEQSRGRMVVAVPRKLRGNWSSPYLRRAIWNLVMNGLKYGVPDAPIVVNVKSDAEHVEISVHNDGAPIPAEQQRLLFKMFSRGVPPRAAGKSWGLGLSLVRGVAEAHSGSVDVSSDSRGTTFTIKIPRNAPIASAYDEHRPFA